MENLLQPEHLTSALSQRRSEPCNDLVVVETNTMWRVSHGAVMRRSETDSDDTATLSSSSAESVMGSVLPAVVPLVSVG